MSGPRPLLCLALLPVAFAASAQTYTQTEEILYQDNTANWPMGQIAQRKSEGALRPAQRAALQAGELAAKGVRGTHAEVNAVNGARAQGLTPTNVSPSRPACPGCQQIMQDLKIQIIDK